MYGYGNEADSTCRRKTVLTNTKGMCVQWLSCPGSTWVLAILLFDCLLFPSTGWNFALMKPVEMLTLTSIGKNSTHC